ncbi:MAG TPA: YncE family protein [bacterium]|nr:YncE family protein [bacterium]
MPTFHRWFGALFLGLAGLTTAWADPPSFLRLQEDIPLSGGDSRFDYQAFDPKNGTLYLAHMGAGQIIIFNTRQGKVITTLSGVPMVTGLFVIPETHRLYASVTRQHQVIVFDTLSLKKVAKIPAGNFPDGMAYSPDTRQLFVADELGGEVTVIDVEKNKRVASIKMGGQVGNVRYDPSRKVILANIQTKNELVVIDPQSRAIIQRHPLREGKHPHGLYLDNNSRLAFLGCDGDEKLVILDLNKFDEIGISKVGKDPDVIDFDPGLGYLYVASESGVVSVFRVRDRKVEKYGDYPVGVKAHSVAVDPQTHCVYFPLEKSGKGPVLRIMKPVN